MHPRNLKTERVLIVGYGVTGASVVRFLQRHDVMFEIADQCEPALAATRSEELSCPVHTQFDATVFAQFDVLILSPGIPRSHVAVVEALSAGVKVIGDIELFACVVDKPVIAVTGSNGKSTVVAWAAHALTAAGINAVACGNIGEPALDSLLGEADVYVLELSSYQLESTHSLKPLAATVLNVSDDHLDRYDDIDHYAATKRTVYNNAQLCIVNQDDSRTWPLAEHSALDAHSERFTLSVDQSAGCRWQQLLIDDTLWLCDGQTALLAQSELAVPGEHNAANALVVIALIEALAIPFMGLKPGVVSFTGLPHRTEYLGAQDGVRWYNDSKGTNVDACMKAISAMPGPVLLIAGGIAKGADFSPLQTLMTQCVRLLVLIGRDRDQISEQLAGTTQIVMAEGLRDAVRICQQTACANDVVLLSPACSSFDMFNNFEDRGEQFAAAVEEVLAA